MYKYRWVSKRVWIFYFFYSGEQSVIQCDIVCLYLRNVIRYYRDLRLRRTAATCRVVRHDSQGLGANTNCFLRAELVSRERLRIFRSMDTCVRLLYQEAGVGEVTHKGAIWCVSVNAPVMAYSIYVHKSPLGQSSIMTYSQKFESTETKFPELNQLAGPLLDAPAADPHM